MYLLYVGAEMWGHHNKAGDTETSEAKPRPLLHAGQQLVKPTATR